MRRLQGDIDAGRRQPDVIPRSLARLPTLRKTGRPANRHIGAQRGGNGELLGFLWQIWYNALEVIVMETKDAIRTFRTKKGLSQTRAGRKGFCDPAGGLPLGDRRDGAQHRHPEGAVPGAGRLDECPCWARPER